MALRPAPVAALAVLALLLAACSGGDGGSEGSGDDLARPAAVSSGSADDGGTDGSAGTTGPKANAVPGAAGRSASAATAVTVLPTPSLSPLPAAGATSSTVAAPPTTTGLPPGTVETVIGRSILRFAEPPGTTAAERPVVDAYHRFLRGLLGSTDPPNPDNADLAATMSVDYLYKERNRLASMQANAQFAFGNYESNPRIVRPLSGEVARIEDCALDSGVRFGPNGDPLSAASTAYGRTVAELDRSSGEWRVRAWNGTGQACSP